MHFKAALLEEINKPPVIHTVETTDLKYGQVLVKNIVSGLCGAQLQEMRGYKGNEKFLPHMMGHEGFGVVEQVGEAVSTVKKGDKVVLHWRKGSGIESPFPQYIYNDKTISSGKVTTLSEYSIVSENRLTTVPDDSDPYICALLGCGMTTALGVINNDANVKFGESVLIVGCGGVGINLIQGAVLASAYPIAVVDINDKKKNLALSVCANKCVGSSNGGIDSLTGHKFDVIIDTTGNPKVIEKTALLLDDNGRYIFVGQPPPGSELKLSNPAKMWTPNGRTFKVSQGGSTNPDLDIPRYVKMHKAGLLKIDKIITHKFSLEQVGSAFEVMLNGEAGRVMVHTSEGKL